MNFPQFWAKGRSGNFLVWRWSLQSLADAQSLADQAARQLAERFQLGDRPPQQGGYYPDRPFREQVLQEIKDDAGEIIAVITRNSYGCQVLNTARVMFVDIDLPEPKRGILAKLFAVPPAKGPGKAQDDAISRIENWTRNNSAWGWRIYQTRAGLRLLATHDVVQADSEVAAGVFEALGADLLYKKLCQTQKCFRARLTPKPWRCGVHGKPLRWPWTDAREERQFRKWETLYQSFAAGWATCQFVRHIGNSTIHPEAQTIVKLHDGPTRVDSKLRLA